MPVAPRPSSPSAAQLRFACHAAHAFGQGALTGGGYATGNAHPYSVGGDLEAAHIRNYTILNQTRSAGGTSALVFVLV
jgi:hypothetical protein